MGQHRIETTVDVPCADVASILRTRPASWLRSFLRLAVLSSARSGTRAQAKAPWFRLGAAMSVAGGSTSLKLIWWPHLEQTDVFDRFAGKLIFAPVGSTTLLRVEGITDTGSDAVADAILAQLLTLLGTAIAADQADDG